MGGRGSGTWIRLDDKRCTDTVLAVDLRRLRRAGALPLPEAPALFVQGLPLRLTWQPQPYGGFRAYLVCPGCTRPVVLLYRLGSWQCRRCHGLTYRTTRCDALARLYRTIHKLRDRLGVGWNLMERVRPSHKPTHMKWKTFWRLSQREAAVHAAILQALAAQLRVLKGGKA